LLPTFRDNLSVKTSILTVVIFVVVDGDGDGDEVVPAQINYRHFNVGKDCFQNFVMKFVKNFEKPFPC
jgi:hypothetical protein